MLTAKLNFSATENSGKKNNSETKKDEENETVVGNILGSTVGRQVARTIAREVTRGLLGVLGLSGTTRRKKSSWF